jgi:hypothetical protein
MEPYRLKRWRLGAVHFFTCARPGRSESADQPVPDEIVHCWVRGLPGPKTAIVSLLGSKPSGLSEYSFYSFAGGSDTAEERASRPTFQEWLRISHPELGIPVRECPTRDFCQMPRETLAAAASGINELLSAGRTVVLMDSGGETRTKTVCKYMGATEDPKTA